MTIAELVDDLRALPPEQQRSVRILLDLWLNNPGKSFSRQEELDHLLLTKGIISRVPPPITDLTPYQNRKPVEITGEPLSETIIRERR
jgi:hypothetical protein